MGPKLIQQPSTKTLRFDNLPLVEVAARLAFRDPWPDLSLSMAATITEAVRERFPDSKVTPTRQVPPGGAMPTKMTLPSVTFVRPSDHLAVILQNDLVVIQWNRESFATLDYPRFQALYENLWWFVSRCEDRGIKWPAFNAVSLSYLNFVAVEGTEATVSLERYLAPAVHVPIVRSAPHLFEVNLSWRTPSNLDRRLIFAYANLQVGGETVNGFVLRTVTGKLLDIGEAGDVVLNAVHDDLQEFFAGAISERAKEEWGYAEQR